MQEEKDRNTIITQTTCKSNQETHNRGVYANGNNTECAEIWREGLFASRS